MKPLNFSGPARSCTHTGVHVPILNVFADFIVDSEASKPTRMFSTSIFGGAAPEDREIAPIKTQTQTITEKRSRALPLVVFVTSIQREFHTVCRSLFRRRFVALANRQYSRRPAQY